ncbi:unnamed protein product [Plutella xylostella]|uniref:(diamondback moth) hypothetical protein n=1 Tax=Plutella xylostella TaxID=51655 RepID=A0A8S4GCH8_PLUXY|nr:unnamed protein product [Plutella xylostella]
MENLKYRVIYEYEFHRGTSAAETALRINDVYGDGVAKENTVRFWFQRFRSGNFQPETKVDNEELKAIVEADPSQTTSELAAGSGVSDKTILIHLKQIGKVKKLDRWVPHELSEANRQTRVDCCVTLLNRHNNEGILNRIITCDEKWILYDNRKRSSQWLNPGEPAKSCPKRKLTKKKLLRQVIDRIIERQQQQRRVGPLGAADKPDGGAASRQPRASTFDHVERHSMLNDPRAGR